MSASAGARPRPGYGPATAPLRLTGRGCMVLMLAAFVLGELIATWVHAPWLGGLGYAAGCLLSVTYARREALLAVVAAPPAIFLGALVAVELLTAPSASALVTLEGTLLALAATAPWLLGITAAYLAAATLRGLPRCVRELRSGLSGAVPPGAGLPGAVPPGAAPQEQPAGARRLRP